MSKALNLMKSKQTLQEKAKEFLPSVRREVRKQFLEELKGKIENIEDKISDAKEFSLTTNLNKGQTGSTRAECKDKFIDILSLEYDLKLAKAELAAKKELFEDYFGTDTAGEEEDED